jgi:hypothetical protein
MADEVQHAETARLEEGSVRADDLRQLIAAGVLENPDRDDLVVGRVHVAEIGLAHVERGAEPAARDLVTKPDDLFGGRVHPVPRAPVVSWAGT